MFASHELDQYTKFRYDNLKLSGVSNPEKIDDFVKEVYTTMKSNNFSLVESEVIVKELSSIIDNDKKLILREPLTTVDKYKEEG